MTSTASDSTTIARSYTQRPPARWQSVACELLEWACVATRHRDGCRMLNGALCSCRWHRFVNRAFRREWEELT